MQNIIPLVLASSLLGSLAFAASDSITSEVHRIDASGIHESLGKIVFRQTPKGLSIEPALKDLSAGQHGLHLHEKAACGPGEKDGKVQAGIAAGPHYDPAKAGAHAGPEGQGHLGDLPFLEVDAKGSATRKLLAPRLKLADIQGRSIMIHEGGDNYSDQPKPLGGGGARIACGVVGK